MGSTTLVVLSAGYTQLPNPCDVSPPYITQLTVMSLLHSISDCNRIRSAFHETILC
jgi:hypothetical protein